MRKSFAINCQAKVQVQVKSQVKSKEKVKRAKDLDFAYCIFISPPPTPPHHKLFKHFQRSQKTKEDISKILSTSQTQILSQRMRKQEEKKERKKERKKEGQIPFSLDNVDSSLVCTIFQSKDYALDDSWSWSH